VPTIERDPPVHDRLPIVTVTNEISALRDSSRLEICLAARSDFGFYGGCDAAAGVL